MTSSLWFLAGTAAVTGAVHTVAGPDHVLPFLALSRLKKWSLRRTLGFTLLCGLGHVGSSIALGALGAALGLGVSRLGMVENRRGELAAMVTLAVGLAYLVWGLRRLRRHRSGPNHSPDRDHGHGSRTRLLPWSLFLIFVFGPCEPLIPLLALAGGTMGWGGVLVVGGVFSLTTLAAMCGLVVLGTWGTSFLAGRGIERYSPMAVGAVLVICGLTMRLGL